MINHLILPVLLNIGVTKFTITNDIGCLNRSSMSNRRVIFSIKAIGDVHKQLTLNFYCKKNLLALLFSTMYIYFFIKWKTFWFLVKNITFLPRKFTKKTANNIHLIFEIRFQFSWIYEMFDTNEFWTNTVVC